MGQVQDCHPVGQDLYQKSSILLHFYTYSFPLLLGLDLATKIFSKYESITSSMCISLWSFSPGCKAMTLPKLDWLFAFSGPGAT